MAIKVAVIDDLESERETLKTYLARMENDGKQSFNVKYYTCSEEVLADTDSKFDIMIFDIDMPGINGMDAAREIRKRDNNVVIMFVTNVAQYAINGYEVGAVDYVLKPISYYDFVMKINRALYKVSQNKDSSIVVDSLDGVCSLKISDIIYVEVMLHYIIYHTKTGECRSRSSMKDVEKELYAHNFRRCHKSFLVNLKYVKMIKTLEIEMKGGAVLPISRKWKNDFMQEYITYIKG